MAVTVWEYTFNASPFAPIPAKGTKYIQIGPSPAINDCAVTVTAHGLAGLVSGPQFLELVQTATRAGPAPNERWLDLVVRNNTERQCPFFRLIVSLVHA